MRKQLQKCIFHISLIIALFSPKAVSGEKERDSSQCKYILGAIVDSSSRVGKEELIAMKMATDETNARINCTLVLHVRDSGQNITQVAVDAMDLINGKQVSAVLGLHKWDEVAFVAELGNKAQVPILSFADSIPPQVSNKWPFLIQATHNNYKQLHAMAAIVGTWQWRKVIFIYEDTDFGSISIVPHLIDALQEVESSIDYMLPLSPSANNFTVELEKLQRKQCRVFIVHTSLSLTSRLFLDAKKMGLMENNSVWITTTTISDHLDYLNSSIISSMQGFLGVKSYYANTGKQYKEFSLRFHKRFLMDYPEDVSFEPGIIALQAYDVVQALALAININIRHASNDNIHSSTAHGHDLLENIKVSNFRGFTGEFHFKDGELVPSNIYRIVNVVDKSYRELGYWVEGSGFSKNVVTRTSAYSMSMQILGPVVWPRGPWSVPSGWELPTSLNPLMIGVPDSPAFNRFVNVRYDVGGKPLVDGHAIDTFKAVLDFLPYQLPYKFIPYNGTYNSLVEQIYYKRFDAVVGDISIVANRCHYAEFSQPWTESGLQIVVLKKSVKTNRAWLFYKPFTTGMWIFTAWINIYNGFAVWLIERNHHPEFNGSILNKVGTLLWLASTTLFSLQADRLHSNLPRMIMVAWIFLILILTQSYTASLTSMLTVPRMEANAITVDYLRKSKAIVGCNKGSFLEKYLVDVLGIHSQNIKPFASHTDYPQALKSGDIAALFLEVPYVKVFLAEHCKDFAVVGPSNKIGGFAFVFPTRSPILPDISKAVLDASEEGKLLELENALLNSYSCSDSEPDDGRLGVTSFLGLFFISGGTTTVAFLLYFLQPFIEQHFDWSTNPTVEGGHAPDNDEIFMFAAEMGSKGNQSQIRGAQ